MATYLIKHKSDAALTRYLDRIRSRAAEINAGVEVARKGRYAVLFIDSDVVRPSRWVVRYEFDGDQRDRPIAKKWVGKNELDKLHDEYVEKAPVDRKRRQKAVRAWREADSLQRRAERMLAKAKTQKVRAVRDIVRTHGIGPITIRGTVYDPGCNGETVYLVPRAEV